MSDLSVGNHADVVLNAGDVLRVSTGGVATVVVAYGAPAGTTTITANTQDFGPYSVPAKLAVNAVTGTASYSNVAAYPVVKMPDGTLQAGGSPVDGDGNSGAVMRVVGLIGQSNIMGRAAIDTAVDVVDGAVWQFGGLSGDARYRTIYQASDPLKHPEVNTSVGPGTWLGRAYARMTSSHVLLVPCGFGATAMVGSRWAPGTPGGDLYENAIDQVNRAIAAAAAMGFEPVFSGWAWVQGEADGDASVTQAVYAATLKSLISGMRARVTGATNAAFVVGQMPPETPQYYPGCVAIDAAHQQVGIEVDHCVFVAGPIGETIAPGSNRHYTSSGVRIHGINMARGLATAASKAAGATPAAPGAPTSLQATTVTSTAVTLSWVNSAGALRVRVEYSLNGSSWTNFPVPSGRIDSVTVSGLTAATNYQFRVACGSAGLYSATALLAQATAGGATSTTFNFAADTVDAAPAGITALKSALTVRDSAAPRWPVGWTGKAAQVSGAATEVSAMVLFTVPDAANQRVTWRRGLQVTYGGQSREGFLLRAQAAATGGLYADMRQGYWFMVSGTTGELRIYKANSSGVALLGVAVALADAADRRFRATATGSTLTFEYSNDQGATWSVGLTRTDTDFASASGVGFVSGASGVSPSSIFLDDILIEALP